MRRLPGKRKDRGERVLGEVKMLRRGEGAVRGERETRDVRGEEKKIWSTGICEGRGNEGCEGRGKWRM